MLVVTNNALAVGITAVPGPVTDVADDGWFVYQPFLYETIELTAVGSRLGNAPLMFDSKAKRRVGEGSVIALVVENAHATHGFDFSFGMRMLTMVTGT